MAGRGATRGMSAIGGFFLTDADATAGLDEETTKQEVVLNPMQGGGGGAKAGWERGSLLVPVGGRASVAQRVSVAARPRFRCTQSHILFGVTAGVGFVVTIVLILSLLERAKPAAGGG